MSRARSILLAVTMLCVGAVAAVDGFASADPTTAAASSAAPPEAAPLDDTPTNGADPNGYAIAQQQQTTVYEPPPGVIAATPQSDAFDAVDANGNPTRSVIMTWQSNADDPTTDSALLLARSTDRGYTFPAGLQVGLGAYSSQLHDGSILSMGFVPTVVDDHTLRLPEAVSKDGGKTWKSLTATFTTDETFDSTHFNRGIRLHRSPIVLPDGDLLQSYYTEYVGDTAGRAEVAVSHDQGRTWSRLATPFPPEASRAFNEMAISYTPNGELVAVVRSHLGTALSQLYTARSADLGRTWSTPTPVSITTATGDPAPVTGIYPDLELMPNGVLALSWGRPDNWVAISTDGEGNSFTDAQVTYHNYPDQDTGTYQRWHGSSGNGSITPVASNRLLMDGDNCAATWGCPATDSGYQIDGKYRVWKKFVDVVTPGVGKIDLLDKYIAGTVKVSTDMTSTAPRLPEMRPVGAIDGSTDWGSSAVLRDASTGTYTLTLDKAYDLDKIGLSLHPGQPSSATVQVSADGQTWTDAVSTGSLTSYALTYFPVESVATKYVRITVNDASTDQSGAFLNEVELYSDVDSFANDAVGYVPRGYTNAVGATVTDVNTPSGDGHALRIADAWNDKIAQATWTSAPAAAENLSFQVDSMGYARTFEFIVNGTNAAGAKVNAYQLAVMSDGSVSWYSATTKAWTKLTPAGTVPLNTWHAISVAATLGGAEVTLDGKVVGTAQPSVAGVTALTGHTFASSGTASTQDNFVIDDVRQTTPS